MQHPFAWYVGGLTAIRSSHRILLHRLEAQFAVRETFRHITEPLFQDTTLSGRFIGILFRIGRSFFALLFYALISLLYLLSALLWALLPILVLTASLGYVTGNTSAPAEGTADLDYFLENN